MAASAQRTDDVSRQVQNVNGKLMNVATQAFTGASASKDLSAVTFRGSPVLSVGPGRLLTFQATQDCHITLSPTSVAATVHDFFLAKNGPGVSMYAEAEDVFVNVIQDSAGGNLEIFVSV